MAKAMKAMAAMKAMKTPRANKAMINSKAMKKVTKAKRVTSVTTSMMTGVMTKAMKGKPKAMKVQPNTNKKELEQEITEAKYRALQNKVHELEIEVVDNQEHIRRLGGTLLGVITLLRKDYNSEVNQMMAENLD